jgi:hypothetical protein
MIFRTSLMTLLILACAIAFSAGDVKYLFDSKGKHIANFIDNQLYAPSGDNIGHYLSREKIFIDMKGRYLGEIVQENRLLYNKYSPYKIANFGVHGYYGNAGNYGNPGNYGSIGMPRGYEDVVTNWLR